MRSLLQSFTLPSFFDVKPIFSANYRYTGILLNFTARTSRQFSGINCISL